MRHDNLLKEKDQMDREFYDILKEIDAEKNFMLIKFDQEYKKFISQIPQEILDMPIDEFFLFND